jgi:hypothetical protein
VASRCHETTQPAFVPAAAMTIRLHLSQQPGTSHTETQAAVVLTLSPSGWPDMSSSGPNLLDWMKMNPPLPPRQQKLPVVMATDPLKVYACCAGHKASTSIGRQWGHCRHYTYEY